MCGSSGGREFDGPATETNCETLTDNTTLNSLNPEALDGLKVGDILDVRAEGSRGPLVVLNHAGGFMRRKYSCRRLEPGFAKCTTR
jgi:hypothetical protein